MNSRGLENKSYAAMPQVRAFLDLTSRAEGTYGVNDNGYNVLYGFGTFSSYAAHPNRAISKGGLTSTAAGRYQFLKKTWDGVKSATGVTDFSPESQDIGAVELFRRRNMLQDILDGKIESAVKKGNKEWASFPGSPYGQGTRSMNQMLSWYASDLAKYGGNVSVNNNNSGSGANSATKIASQLSAGADIFGAILLIGFAAGIIYYIYKS